MKRYIGKQRWQMLMIALLSAVLPVAGTASGADGDPKMKYPAFFDKINPIVLKDPLGEFIGTSQGGILEINYVDTVKMAGHKLCRRWWGLTLRPGKGSRHYTGTNCPAGGK